MKGQLVDICNNRKARFEYFILDTFEAGIVLQGTEIKVVRQRKVTLDGSYVDIIDNEAWLIGTHIEEYTHGNVYNHSPKRNRKLLLKKQEIKRIADKVKQKGFTVVPLKMYIKNGIAKVEIGIAEGKKLYDKRETIKERDAKREMDRSK